MFPYEQATWDVVDGAMFQLWGTSMPGFFTLIAMALCVVVLIVGQRSETEKAKRFD